MKFTNFKISHEYIFPVENVAHVRSRKTFYHISVNFRNPRFCSVSKPRKPVFIFRTSPTTMTTPSFHSQTTSVKIPCDMICVNTYGVTYSWNGTSSRSTLQVGILSEILTNDKPSHSSIFLSHSSFQISNFSSFL